MVCERKLGSRGILPEFSQMDSSSLLRHLRKTEASLGLDCPNGEETLWEAQLGGRQVAEKPWKPHFRVSQEWTLKSPKLGQTLLPGGLISFSLTFFFSPKAEPKAEKSEHKPRSHGVEGPQKEPVVPGIVDFKVVREELGTAKPETPNTYHFGRLSHNSFFSRHHPHPHRVTHIKDLTGKPVCVVKDRFSLTSLPQTAFLSPSLMGMPALFVPIGDPQSNRDPRLKPEAWKKELKELASQVVILSKENEPKNKEEEVPQREQGAKYSAETGRLIPASIRALSSRHSHQGQGNHPSSRDGTQAFVLQDQELLVDSPERGNPTFLGHQVLHPPSQPQPPASRSPSGHRGHQHPRLESPRSAFERELDLFHTILAWRAQRKKGPDAAPVAAAEDGAASKAGKELGTVQFAEPAGPSPWAAHWEQPASWLASPDSEFGNFRVGRLVGTLKSPTKDSGIWDSILELLCQILQTDSLSAIQFWLLYAPPKEKAQALGLLQTAVAQLLPQGLGSIPTEKLLNQLQDVQEPSQERQQPTYSQSPKKSKTPPLPKSEKPEYIGKAQVLQVHPSQSTEEKVAEPKAEC